MIEIPVRLANHRYAIRIEPGLLQRTGEEVARVAKGPRIHVATDRQVAQHYLKPVAASLERAGFAVSVTRYAPGEPQKNLASVEKTLRDMARAGIDRWDALVALGGGIPGDTGGFAAAVWMRGIPCVQIPTTLVAQVDSSVGGKTGVNLPAGKNLVGAFHQPALVLADPRTLDTLSDREYRAGLAEVVKYGMIRDRSFFAELERDHARILDRDPETVARIVSRSCEIKREYVEADEKERSGRRAHLNYGHTFGHAIESATRYRRYLHGEAVALGMVAAARTGRSLKRLSAAQEERLRALLTRFRLPVSGVPAAPAALMERMKRDKKARGGRVRIVLTRGIGSASLSPNVGEAAIRQGFARICSRRD